MKGEAEIEADMARKGGGAGGWSLPPAPVPPRLANDRVNIEGCATTREADREAREGPVPPSVARGAGVPNPALPLPRRKK
jgi:hypothetical protein